MNYKEFSELCKSKGIQIKDVVKQIGYTRQGLETAMNRETIELRKLKILCEVVRISPAQFFEMGTYGVNIHNSTAQVGGSGNKIIMESKDREIELLKEQIKSKDEIISLLKEQIKSNK